MADYGKWVGGALGWALGGPIGALFGYQVGKMFQGFTTADGEPNVFEKRTQRGDFSMALVVLSAAVMKADGKILKSELNYVKDFLKINFGPKEAEQLTLLLRSVLKENINYRQVASQIRFHMDHPKRMLLLKYLYGIANADGRIDVSEVKKIFQISDSLRINSIDFESIKAMFIKSTDDAYKILEVSPDSSDLEVKKAYREMAKKYHPDKIQSNDEALKKGAKEKFQRVQDAYEKIQKERGF